MGVGPWQGEGGLVAHGWIRPVGVAGHPEGACEVIQLPGHRLDVRVEEEAGNVGQLEVADLLLGELAVPGSRPPYRLRGVDLQHPGSDVAEGVGDWTVLRCQLRPDVQHGPGNVLPTQHEELGICRRKKTNETVKAHRYHGPLTQTC